MPSTSLAAAPEVRAIIVDDASSLSDKLVALMETPLLSSLTGVLQVDRSHIVVHPQVVYLDSPQECVAVLYNTGNDFLGAEFCKRIIDVKDPWIQPSAFHFDEGGKTMSLLVWCMDGQRGGDHAIVDPGAFFEPPSYLFNEVIRTTMNPNCVLYGFLYRKDCKNRIAIVPIADLAGGNYLMPALLDEEGIRQSIRALQGLYMYICKVFVYDEMHGRSWTQVLARVHAKREVAAGVSPQSLLQGMAQLTLQDVTLDSQVQVFQNLLDSNRIPGRVLFPSRPACHGVAAMQRYLRFAMDSNPHNATVATMLMLAMHQLPADDEMVFALLPEPTGEPVPIRMGENHLFRVGVNPGQYAVLERFQCFSTASVVDIGASEMTVDQFLETQVRPFSNGSDQARAQWRQEALDNGHIQPVNHPQRVEGLTTHSVYSGIMSRIRRGRF